MKKIFFLVLICGAYSGSFSQNTFPSTGNVLINTATDNGNQLQVNGSATTAKDILVNGITVGRGAGTTTYNTAFGYNALKNNAAAEQNTAIGYNALQNNTSGTNNSAFGAYSLGLNTTGVRNTALGNWALEHNTTGNYNAAIGYEALGNNTSGIYNNAIGHYALYTNAVGNGNFASGQGALYYSTGSYNIGLGYFSGYNQSSGDNNIVIGTSIDLPSHTGSNQLNIGNVIYGTGINSPTAGAGNIGIGTTSPRSKLEAIGTGMFSSSASGSSFTIDATGLPVDNIWSNVRLTAGGSGGAAYLKTSLDNWSGYFSWSRGSESGQQVEIMRISGYPGYDMVGIGTATPRAKLDVAGPILSWTTGFGGADSITSSKNWANFGSNLYGTAIMSSNIYLNSDNVQKMFVAKDHSSVSGAAIVIPGNSQPYQNSILFYTNPVAAVTHDAPYTGNIAMMINSANSNVGIGTTSPTEKLAVNGNVRAKKVIVTQSGWADYVFESSYKLPSLDSIAAYIKANKHLPGMTTANAIEKDGLDLGNVLKQQQEKIEELMLYMIELKEENKALKKEVAELKTK